MQIERAIGGVKTLGPGNRLAIWVNGCHRRCVGCVSWRLQEPAPQNNRDIQDFFDEFDLEYTDGITVSGGEPFDQLSELKCLVEYFRKRGLDDILIYTGYTMEELLLKNDERVSYILNNISVLIDGPYLDEQNSNRGNLKGSDNQRVLVINPEYQKKYDDYYKEEREMQEFRLGPFLVAAGIPSREYISAFLKK